MTTGMDMISPQKIITPISIPNIPATPSGPGVGGTAECVTTNPTASATPIVNTDFRVFLEIPFTSEVNITKAASQNTGIDTMYPVAAIAHSSLCLPNHLINE